MLELEGNRSFQSISLMGMAWILQHTRLGAAAPSWPWVCVWHQQEQWHRQVLHVSALPLLCLHFPPFLLSQQQGKNIPEAPFKVSRASK